MRALLALALVVTVLCAFVAVRLFRHAARVAALQARVIEVTARCAALNDAKHRLLSGQTPRSTAEIARLDPTIDRCERELSDADLAWGAEVARSGWRAVW